MIVTRLDVDGLTRELSDLGRTQLPFVVARTLNALGTLAQAAQREDQRARLAIRPGRRAFFDRMVKIAPADRATKDRPQVVVRIAGPAGDPARGDLLARFEEAGFDEAANSRGVVALPGRDIRTGQGGQVKRGYELRNFTPFYPATRRWESRLAGRTRTVALVEREVGRNDTWLVTLQRGRAKGQRALLQRRGRDVRLLYLWTPRVRRPDRVDFAETVQTVAARHYAIVFQQQMDAALETAWGRDLRRATPRLSR